MLFTQPNEKLDYKNLKIFIYGDSGVGKSYFWNTFPGNTRLISTDGNYKHLPNKNFDKFVIAENNVVPTTHKGKEGFTTYQGWAVFKHLINLAKQNEYGFADKDTIVIDVIFDIYQFCRTHILNRMGISHESDIGYGKGYKAVEDEFFPVIKELLSIEKNIIIIAHEKTVEGKKIPKEGETFYNKIHPYFQLKGRAIRTESEGQEKFTISFVPSLQSVGGNVFNIKAPVANDYQSLINIIKKVNNIEGE